MRSLGLLLRVVKNVLKLVVTVVQLSKYSKTYWFVYFKIVNLQLFSCLDILRLMFYPYICIWLTSRRILLLRNFFAFFWVISSQLTLIINNTVLFKSLLILCVLLEKPKALWKEVNHWRGVEVEWASGPFFGEFIQTGHRNDEKMIKLSNWPFSN